MKTLDLDGLQKLLSSLSADWDVLVPVALTDGTRALGRLDEGPLAICGGKIPRKPTSVFFPQFERVFTATADGRVETPRPPAKPILAVGFTAQDLDCLEFLDKFFSTNWRDALYFNRRDGSVVVGVSGRCGKDGEFLKIAGGKCDLELICDGERFIVAAHSKVGRDLEGKIKGSGSVASIEALQKESDALPTEELDTLTAASRLILDKKVPDEFWAEIGTWCIACSACNLACPTCNCFDVQDWRYPDGKFERSRIWDSCQFDGFMRETSGHNPLGTQGLRTWRRIHHKLGADQERWGFVTCMVCGRCDDVCPTGIGIKAVTRQIVERYGR